jgi:hypothetical protein
VEGELGEIAAELPSPDGPVVGLDDPVVEPSRDDIEVDQAAVPPGAPGHRTELVAERRDHRAELHGRTDSRVRCDRACDETLDVRPPAVRPGKEPDASRLGITHLERDRHPGRAGPRATRTALDARQGNDVERDDPGEEFG